LETPAVVWQDPDPYHSFNEEDTRFPIYDGIRETYDGPLSMATDSMMWNIRRDEITERRVISPDVLEADHKKGK
jgi:hypothetical protein